LTCPVFSIIDHPEMAIEATRKKSLLRHENWFVRNGGITVQHFTRAADILPQLDVFFEQHIARWADTGHPSLFNDPLQKLFYKKICEAASEAGWLRFTMITWQQAIAFHFGMNYKGSFLWYKPAFDITLAKHSPGEVLLRQLLLKAIDEKASYFDLGLGDEAFKERFSSSAPSVTNIGLYPEP
jgi:CelD/BcsL family acetyltransferase involved in cellulose biosynthesis